MNATYIDPDFTLQPTGSGTLDELTFAVDDSIAIAGRTAGLGSPAWQADQQPATTTAPIVTKLLAAGATLKGITVVDELMVNAQGNNPHYGAPDNQLHPDCFSGGASGGAASAVAAGDVDFAVGIDTDGSLRIPASYSGLFAIRMTQTTDALAGNAQLAPGFDALGWLASDKNVFKKVADVLLTPTKWHSLQLISAPINDRREALRAAFAQLHAQAANRNLGAWVAAHQTDLGATAQAFFADAAKQADRDAQPALTVQADWRQELNHLLKKAVMPLPTTAAPLKKDAGADTIAKSRFETQGLTSLAELAGCPELVIPTDEGTSRAFVGPVDSDAGLVAYALHRASVHVGEC